MAEKKDKIILPSMLQKFIDENNRTIVTQDGEWEIHMDAESAFDSKVIPDDAFLIANNGFGDSLFLLPSESNLQELDTKIYVFWHEENKFELFNDDINNLLLSSREKPSDHSIIYYFGGEVEVKLGDEISARDLVFRKKGRVAYVPGISPINRELERDRMAWIGIRFEGGTMGGAYIEHENNWVKKSVKYIGRSDAEFDPIKPDEKF